MQKRKLSGDPNTLAAQIVAMSTGSPVPGSKADAVPVPPVKEKNPAAVALGRLGGLKGGKARADKLTPARRKAIARNAAAQRWKTT